MFEVASVVSNSILKDAKEMKKKAEEALPLGKEKMWRKIQEEIESAANRGFFVCRICRDCYQIFSYKEVVTTLKSKGYQVKFSKSDYKNGFILYIYWK